MGPRFDGAQLVFHALLIAMTAKKNKSYMSLASLSNSCFVLNTMLEQTDL